MQALFVMQLFQNPPLYAPTNKQYHVPFMYLPTPPSPCKAISPRLKNRRKKKEGTKDNFVINILQGI
jgi:hypothetical protein